MFIMTSEFNEQSVSSTIKMEVEPDEEISLNTTPIPSLIGSVRVRDNHDLIETVQREKVKRTTRLKIIKPTVYGRKAFLRKVHDFMSFLELDTVMYPIGTTPESKANLRNTVRKALDHLEQVKRVIYDLNDFEKTPLPLRNLKPRLEIKNTAMPMASSSLSIWTPLGGPRSGAVVLPIRSATSNHNNVVRANQHFVPTERIRIVSVSAGIPNPDDVVLSNEVPTSQQIVNVPSVVPNPDSVVLSNEIPTPQTSNPPALVLSDFEVVRFDANTDTVADHVSVGENEEIDDCIIVFQSNNSEVDVDIPAEFQTKG